MRTWTFTWKKYFGEEEAYAGGLDPLQSQKGTDMAEFNFPPQHKLQKVKISLLICCVETFLFRNFYLADCNQHFCSITSIYPLLSRCLKVLKKSAFKCSCRIHIQRGNQEVKFVYSSTPGRNRKLIAGSPLDDLVSPLSVVLISFLMMDTSISYWPGYDI